LAKIGRSRFEAEHTYIKEKKLNQLKRKPQSENFDGKRGGLPKEKGKKQEMRRNMSSVYTKGRSTKNEEGKRRGYTQYMNQGRSSSSFLLGGRAGKWTKRGGMGRSGGQFRSCS